MTMHFFTLCCSFHVLKSSFSKIEYYWKVLHKSLVHCDFWLRNLLLLPWFSSCVTKNEIVNTVSSVICPNASWCNVDFFLDNLLETEHIILVSVFGSSQRKLSSCETGISPGNTHLTSFCLDLIADIPSNVFTSNRSSSWSPVMCTMKQNICEVLRLCSRSKSERLLESWGLFGGSWGTVAPNSWR